MAEVAHFESTGTSVSGIPLSSDDIRIKRLRRWAGHIALGGPFYDKLCLD
jgi:hypothetical protein